MKKRHYLITGGAGFIGSNYVHRLVTRGEQVTVYDNLSRRGARENLAWLWETCGKKRFTFVYGNVCDAAKLTAAAGDAEVIVHLAAQVAVTEAVTNPRTDFETNALGTFNVLEAARLTMRPPWPIVLYASTNKVYGRVPQIGLEELSTRYAYRAYPHGIPESYPRDPHSPYGCSKCAGDQYVRDYARIYGLPTVVFRQSCIYGPRQFGVEDQGGVAWFIIAALLGSPITIYGDGKQVRDLLYVEDLLDAYDAAVAHIDQAAGHVYNIGGGPDNQLSIWNEFQPLLQDLLGRPISATWERWRPGDQRIFIADIRKAARELDWRPQVSVPDGIGRLYRWVSEHRAMFERFSKQRALSLLERRDR